MRILLADDHPVVRSGLHRIVSQAFPTAEIDEASSCEEVLERLRSSPVSVLVLDIALGERNSLDWVDEFRRLQPGLAIVVLSMYGERQFILRALRIGVSAYLTKDRAPEELLRAIRSVLQGKRYLGENVAEQIADFVAIGGSGADAPHELLSPREYEVLLLLAAARSVSDIAATLDLSVKTVSTYRTRILEKMGLTSNAQLMRYALEHRLVK
ncbi:MAG: response regulator transcription factor [Acidobacteria bacterium]|nr:response regulator transcription factor [Acidobacteriota bacterium]